jgi:hypothetical protein
VSEKAPLLSPPPPFSHIIAFYGVIPMGENDKRAMFWGFISIFFAFPTVYAYY